MFPIRYLGSVSNIKELPKYANLGDYMRVKDEDYHVYYYDERKKWRHMGYEHSIRIIKSLQEETKKWRDLVKEMSEEILN
jgi:hypothetical protein